MIGTRPIPIPPGSWNGPPHQLLNALARLLAERVDVARVMVGLSQQSNDGELVGWLFIYEAWTSRVSKEEFESHTPRVMPRDDPNRMEVRVAHVVDRAGYRYTVQRERYTDDVLLMVDDGENPDEQDGMKGRLIDALAAVMAATPEVVE